MSVKTCCCLLQGLIWQITQKLLIQTLVPGCFLHMKFNFCCRWSNWILQNLLSYSPFPFLFRFFPFVEVGIEVLRFFNLRARVMECGVEPWADCGRTGWLWLCFDVQKGDCMWTAALQRSRGRGTGIQMSQSPLVGHREMRESADGSDTHHSKASQDRRIKDCQLQKFKQEAWKK